ncbi:hypothetical protein [Rhodohalobacter sp. SW132]|uniref:hypothetical protein n=1 Tax=Rhodohalobacter sp. SW132 TaxID=2293433 RepID=UPI00131466C7|nr:hypothetical protein [Rhodohalobacter sp. SW132]
MSYYPIKEDYIGDLSDLEPKRNLTDTLEFYAYLAAAFVVGIGIGVGVVGF